MSFCNLSELSSFFCLIPRYPGVRILSSRDRMKKKMKAHKKFALFSFFFNVFSACCEASGHGASQKWHRFSKSQC
jgi:hypothetical protein